jgi:hypothetical protein
MGPGGLATPETGAGACGRPPNKPTAASAVREDGGVVWSSDGAPFAHPVWSCLIIAYGFIHDIGIRLCRVCARL